HSTYAMASVNCFSLHRYFLLPRNSHGVRSLVQRPASLRARVAFAFIALKITSGFLLAETTAWTWFVRTFTIHNCQPRFAHVSRIADSPTNRARELSFTGGCFSNSRSCCRLRLDGGRPGVPYTR